MVDVVQYMNHMRRVVYGTTSRFRFFERPFHIVGKAYLPREPRVMASCIKCRTVFEVTKGTTECPICY